MSRYSIAVPAIAIIFLSFLAGSFITYFEFYPFPTLERAYKALKAQYFVSFVANDPNQIQWFDQRYLAATERQTLELDENLQRHGVTRHDATLAYAGYTIYSAGPASFPIELIDMTGNTVHEWRVPVDQLSGPAVDVDLSGRERVIQVRRVKLQPDGSLIVILTYYIQHTPYGMGILKLDRDSNIVWQNMNNAHHDAEVGEDGAVYLLTHDIVTEAPAWPKSIKAPYLSENVAILDSDGQELKTISVLAALRNSNYTKALQYIDGEEELGDIMHANSIDVVTPGQTILIPGAKAGDILVSIRNADTLALIDPDAEQVTWAARGTWHMQHDADLLANGNILMFDNLGKISGRQESRILEIDPQTLGIVWEFPKRDAELISSKFLGSQQRLPNGNTIITESWTGRILEVTSADQVAWEYYLPHLRKARPGVAANRAAVYSAERFSSDQIQFELNRP